MPDKKLGELVDGLVFPHVHADQGLDLALERMGANQIDILPVVSRADVHKLEGIVTLRDVLDSYGVSSFHRTSGLASPLRAVTKHPGRLQDLKTRGRKRKLVPFPKLYTMP